jgi:REP element-mobilizing transposase RayT
VKGRRGKGKANEARNVMPRRPRLDAEGILHHVMVRGIERCTIFRDDKDLGRFMDRLEKQAESTGTKVYAWALIPNHFHLLIRSGTAGISTFMRRLLTGYAVTYNRRHNRCGHLFQNRYRSIICDEDSYLLELVRYIHLNPIRAHIVDTMEELDRYRWSGHKSLIAKQPLAWQDRERVLGYFGKTEQIARQNYRRYVAEGISQGHRPELTGGGLIRSLGIKNKTEFKMADHVLTDERVLGTGDFVKEILEKVSKRELNPLPQRQEKADQIVTAQCQKAGINTAMLTGGSKTGFIVKARADIATKLIYELGYSYAETARRLGVTTAGICKMMKRV